MRFGRAACRYLLGGDRHFSKNPALTLPGSVGELRSEIRPPMHQANELVLVHLAGEHQCLKKPKISGFDVRMSHENFLNRPLNPFSSI